MVNYYGEGKGYQLEILNVFFLDILCNKVFVFGIVIQGFVDKKIKNIFLNNIEIKWVKNVILSINVENVVMNEVFIGEKVIVFLVVKQFSK